MPEVQPLKATFEFLGISREEPTFLQEESIGLATVGALTNVNLENMIFYKGKATLFAAPATPSTTIKSVKVDDTTYTDNEWEDGVEITPTSTIYVALQAPS